MRRRFFVDHFDEPGKSASLAGESARHLGGVLRAQPGQLYELSDGHTAWLARVESVGRERVDFALVEPVPAVTPAGDVTLLLSIVKFDAFEWALEKATELGVSTVAPLAAARSEKNLVAAAAKRSERWRKILFESSQQSRRLRLPVLAEAVTVDKAFASYSADLRVFLSERADAERLKQVLGAVDASVRRAVVLAVGPEGGWTEEEVAMARATGFCEASLGPLILRTETAVISGLAILNFWQAGG